MSRKRAGGAFHAPPALLFFPRGTFRLDKQEREFIIVTEQPGIEWKHCDSLQKGNGVEGFAPANPLVCETSKQYSEGRLDCAVSSTRRSWAL